MDAGQDLKSNAKLEALQEWKNNFSYMKL